MVYLITAIHFPTRILCTPHYIFLVSCSLSFVQRAALIRIGLIIRAASPNFVDERNQPDARVSDIFNSSQVFDLRTRLPRSSQCTPAPLSLLLFPHQSFSHSHSKPAHHACGLHTQLLHESHLRTFQLRMLVCTLEHFGVCLTRSPIINLRQHSHVPARHWWLRCDAQQVRLPDRLERDRSAGKLDSDISHHQPLPHPNSCRGSVSWVGVHYAIVKCLATSGIQKRTLSCSFRPMHYFLLHDSIV